MRVFAGTVASSGALWVALALGAPGTAAAQDDIPNDQAIELQIFQPAVGPQRFLTVSGADVMPKKQMQFGIVMTYLTDPLVVYTVESDDSLMTRTTVVGSIFGAQIGGAYGLSDKLQLGATVPLTLTMNGDGLDPETGMSLSSGLSVTGFGDAILEGAYRFHKRDGLSLAGVVALTLPTSFSMAGEGVEQGAFLGDDLPGLRPRAALEWKDPGGKVTVGANLGFVFHKPRTLYSTKVGQQLTYGIAAAYHATERVDVVGELFGRNGFSTDVDANPMEVDAALRVGVTGSIGVLVGGGAGIVRGLGAPGLRVFAAVSWSPDFGDSDGDGVNNMKDRCPYQSEDRDGFEDGDGCPDNDNDGDIVSDAEDKCPMDAEDKDAFEDDDGCPEVDNDKDGIADLQDKCPNDVEDKAAPSPTDGCPAGKRDSDDDGLADNVDKCPTEFEDADGFADEDGCPETDADGDGVLDEQDGCPMFAEDKDGFQDDDGCADDDNDLDGFTDGQDKCPGEAETVNGVNDWDGCPDAGGKRLAALDESGNRVVLADKIAWDGAKPKAKSNNLLDQTALTMRATPGVKKWRVVVAAEKQKNDELTRALSQQRADAVKAHLVAKGIPEDRIEAVGVVGESALVAVVVLERDEAAAAPKDPPPPEGTTEPEIEMTPE